MMENYPRSPKQRFRNGEEDTLPEGYVLRWYRIAGVLGKGGFGITYRAWDMRHSEHVAVKEMFPSKVVERDRNGFVSCRDQNNLAFFNHVRKRFYEEASIIRNLGANPNIVQIYDVFDENGTAYYVMEYLDGEDMRHYEGHHPHIGWQQLAHPVWDVLQNLKVLHGIHMIHRDISPDNIFMLRNGGARLIDFGSARRMEADHYTTFLKKEFAPVEQFYSDGEQGPWTDTYSLCATLYYMLTGGTLPARSWDRKYDIEEKKPDPLISIYTFHPDAPEYVSAAVMKGLSLSAQGRFQNIAELQKALFPTAGNRMMHELACVSGFYAGRKWVLPAGKTLTIGRTGSGEEHFIAYPANTRGISRKQAALYVDRDGIYFVCDLNSSYGTFVDGTRLQPMKWYRIGRANSFSIGGDSYRLLTGG